MTEKAGAVIGINLGNSYGSLACINQHGRADVIANEDGERQLATRIAFAGDQVYIGNQATPQLVRNAPNVIDRFVNLLGVKFSQATEADKKRISSPLIDVGDDTPGFEVEINGEKTKLSAHQVAVRYLNSLFLTAKEFLSGVPIAGCVLSYPPFFSSTQMEALKKAAQEAGLIALQLVPTSAAALVAYNLTSPLPGGQLPAHPDGEAAESAEYPSTKVLDRNVVVLDVGGSSTDVTVISARAGLYSVLAYVHDAALGGATIDDAMIQYFAKEFTKKTKVAIEAGNTRAWTKLRNEVEVTKRALSASNSAQCSVESLAEGIDFSGPLNRMRLDMLAAKVYDGAISAIKQALKEAGLEAAHVDEVVLAGGSARLGGFVDALQVLFPEETSHTKVTSSIDSDQVIARGCAIQAQALAALTTLGETPERKHISDLPVKGHAEILELKTPATSKAIGLVVPAPDVSKLNGSARPTEKAIVDGKLFVPIIAEKTPLPARRVVQLLSNATASALLEFAEAESEIHIETIAPPEADPVDEDEDEEPLEPEEVRTVVYKPSRSLGQLAAPAGKSGKIQVQVIVNVDGSVDIKAGEPGAESAAELKLPAP
ncbi:actin-like ATPase domain-containing protein [Tilletiaria anomala UBC 951]|uniref:Actin-like ATPase domain-containing protein n=1 Tax=Tilletiaria anomala (strain ATCC 24038 / CBS 436.72 / UBC 951) TaxID=1037660 RepID=A0A066W3Y3_TILAU|nr:actin-like ATPase domain-containing protein [Tilletiaria anomala UBC 951]KDN45480.1 actin-like ATPase domain-containing protein [Tilletiaria anomala UBC 951]